ncbi:MAG: DUF3618 domain-containing protein [Gemmatimonadota bacterium]|nr:DUF3618 domain-containing protein [Gemmatimonadota bacterium]
MVETTADVRRDIELTRERMSTTLEQLEQKLNVGNVIRDHPWPAIAVAAGAGFLLASTRADVKTASAAVAATGGASNRVAGLLDAAAARVLTQLTGAFHDRLDGWVGELKDALGASNGSNNSSGSRSRPVTVAAQVVDRELHGALDTGRRSDQILGLDQPMQDSGAIVSSTTSR